MHEARLTLAFMLQTKLGIIIITATANVNAHP